MQANQNKHFSVFNLARLVLISLIFFSTSISADPSLEYKIKAVFVYKLLKFVSWKDQNKNEENADVLYSRNICLFGNGELITALKASKREKFRGTMRPAVRIINASDEVKDCNVLVIGKSKVSQLSELFDAIKNKSILTVSDITTFSTDCGMIGFVIVNGKVKLMINHQLIKTKNIHVSSKLLELSILVNTCK